jgi:hypothetical protein
MLSQKGLERGLSDASLKSTQVPALQQSLHCGARAANILRNLTHRQWLMLQFLCALLDTLLVFSKRREAASVVVVPTLDGIAFVPVPAGLPSPRPLVARQHSPKKFLDRLRGPLQFIRHHVNRSSHTFRFLSPCNNQSGF